MSISRSFYVKNARKNEVLLSVCFFNTDTQRPIKQFESWVKISMLGGLWNGHGISQILSEKECPLYFN